MIKVIQKLTRIVIRITDWLRKYSIPYSNPYTPPTHTYKHLICTNGFGWSGSGTILDYLSEFDNTTTFGNHDKAYSGFDKDNMAEIDFLRQPGGVFDLEHAFNRGSFFFEDFSVEFFLSGAEFLYRCGHLYNDKYWELTNEFVNKIVDLKTNISRRSFGYIYFLPQRASEGRYSNLNSRIVNRYSDRKYIYYLKDLSVEEYQKIAKDYILSFLNSIESKDFLVLDQILSNKRLNMEHKMKYLGDFKLICSYRDPRDVYCTGRKHNISNIPSNPVDFVKWFIHRGVPAYLKEEHPNKLMIRFEDFVLHYDETAEKINRFIGIDESHHVHKKEYFIPDVSKQNIGLYKSYPKQDEIEYIYNHLKEYCYEE